MDDFINTKPNSYLSNSEDSNNFFEVHLHKTTYNPCEDVQGAIHLNMEFSLIGWQIVLKIKGKESVNFIAPEEVISRFKLYKSEAFNRFKKNIVHLNHMYQIIKFEETEGNKIGQQYVIPFTFKLPSDLPNSISLDWMYKSEECTAKTFYYIKAYLA